MLFFDKPIQLITTMIDVDIRKSLIRILIDNLSQDIMDAGLL